MSESDARQRDQGMSGLSVDPDLLAEELAAEQDIDPLDAIEAEGSPLDSQGVARACDQGLVWLEQGHDQRLQGLRIFCEHRDPRAVPLLLTLLTRPCPVERMSAVSVSYTHLTLPTMDSV